MNEFEINSFKGISQKDYLNYKNTDGKSELDISLRRKIHQLLAENYQVKQKMMKQQNQVVLLREQNADLKEQIERLLQQRQIKNQAIKRYKQTAERVEYLSQQNQKLKEIVNDVQAEALLLGKIKEKYASDLKAVKEENAKILIEIRGREDADRQVSQNVYRANRQIQELLNQIKNLQIQKEQYNRQIYQFESMLIEADSRLQRSLDNEQILKNQIQKYKIKADKYKRRALQYKKERNQIAGQFERGQLQVGALKFKNYFPEEDLQF